MPAKICQENLFKLGLNGGYLILTKRELRYSALAVSYSTTEFFFLIIYATKRFGSLKHIFFTIEVPINSF